MLNRVVQDAAVRAIRRALSDKRGHSRNRRPPGRGAGHRFAL
jgi:hypothetical protein